MHLRRRLVIASLKDLGYAKHCVSRYTSSVHYTDKINFGGNGWKSPGYQFNPLLHYAFPFFIQINIPLKNKI